MLTRDGRVWVCPASPPDHAPLSHPTTDATAGGVVTARLLCNLQLGAGVTGTAAPAAAAALSADVMEFFVQRSVVGLVRYTSVSLFDLKVGTHFAFSF